MRRALLVVLVLVLTVPAFAQTQAQIRTAVDTWLTARWPAVQAAQANYLALRGRYWQGLRTHTFRPVDGASTAPDNTNNRPTDQTERWADFLALPATMPAVFEMTVYDGPLGRGYVATVEVTLGKNTWSRSQNSGPETWRTVGWHQVIEAP